MKSAFLKCRYPKYANTSAKMISANFDGMKGFIYLGFEIENYNNENWKTIA
jgi:hypothetical protein